MTDTIRLYVPDWSKNATLIRLLERTKGTIRWRLAMQTDSFMQRILREVHDAKSYLTCGCNAKKAKLYVTRRGHTYHIARYPMTGEQHSAACHFFDVTAGSNATKAVGHDDSKIRLKFGRHITHKSEAECRSLLNQKLRQGGTSYPRQALLMLFRSLWEGAGLNVYDPGLRMNWSVIRSSLLKQSERYTWAGTSFADSLILPIPPSKTELREQEINDDIKKLKTAADRGDRVVLIAPVWGWLRPKAEKGKDHAILQLAINAPGHKDAMTNLYGIRVILSSAQFNRLSISYNRGFAAVSARMREASATSSSLKADEKLKVIVVATCQVLAKQGRITLVANEACLDVLTRDFVPCDSSYEIELARALAKDRRKYRKPLLHSEWSNMLPDFELLDVGSLAVPIEVFGFSTEAYIEKKHQKIAAYHDSRREFWYWDPISDKGSKLNEIFETIPSVNTYR